jgi:hypothetical protein
VTPPKRWRCASTESSERSVGWETTIELSAAQQQAIANGEAVSITVGPIKCVLRADLYERVQALLDLEATYPLLDETFREGWEAPGMADYDRYDELKPR